MVSLQLPETVQWAMKRLEEAGCACWAVGGFVRDTLMGVPRHDAALAAAAGPQEIGQALGEEGLIPDGEERGALILERFGMTLKIRALGTAEGILADLQKRDFTVNAMAWSPAGGLIDPFGGRDDLTRRRLKCVGAPEDTFREDPLSLLRVLRLAACLEMDIEENTKSALRKKAAGIKTAGRERVRDEMGRMLLAPGFAAAALDCPEVLFEAVEELRPMAGCLQRCPWHIYDVWEHSVRAVDSVPPVPLLKWSALLHDVGKPHMRVTDENGVDHFRGHEAVGADIAEGVLSGLRLPRETVDTAVRLIRLHDRRFRVGDVKNVMRRLGPVDTRSLIWLQRGDMLAHSPLVAERAPYQLLLLQETDRVEMSGEPYTVAQMKITGQDLENAGLPASRTGQVLEELLTLVMAGEAANEREALLRAARRIG